ncbi:MAG: FkbM family methyltransferase [Gemmatimonadales bacterium]
MPHKLGAYQSDLTAPKDLLDFWLTRFPRLYLSIEEHREWQNWDKRVYLSVIERGDTVIDVGANVGAHTVAFSHIVGSNGKVFSIEPVEANYVRLASTVRRRTRFTNTILIKAAVGLPARPGQSVIVRVPGDDFTQAALVAHTEGSWRSGQNVREYHTVLTSVDAEVERARPTRVDFLKIDVEGGELDVVKGAANTLKQFLPLVYCEVYEKWAESFGYTPLTLFSLVRDLGYTESRIIRDGRVNAIRLGDKVPTNLFRESADVLFAAPHHSARMRRFDVRYHAVNRGNGDLDDSR